MAKILIIDDERAIRNTLKDILDFEGYEVEVVENGKIGLERATSGTFDLIYSDVKMPEMDGIEFLTAYRQALEADPDRLPAPIVMISGHGNIETAVDALKKGAFDFIEKPLDLNRLLVTTKNALQHGSQTQEIKEKTEEIQTLRNRVASKN